MNAPQVPSGFKLTGNAALDGLILKLIFGALTALATWLATQLKIADPAFVTNLATDLLPVAIGAAVLAYGWIMSKVNQAKAVQAGINLTVSGQAVTTDGEKIVSLGSPDASPPKSVTTASAPEIVKNFSAPVK